MYIIVETYKSRGENSSSEIRARALPGQWAEPSLKVQCSKTMRGKHPIGTKLRIDAKIIDREGTPQLYSYYNSKYRVMNDEDIRKFFSSK